MPEMPEVETVRRGLMRIAAGRQIKGIDVNYGKTIENDVEEFGLPPTDGGELL